MSRRLRRPLAVLASVLLTTSLAACGGDDSDDSTINPDAKAGFDAVSISGDFGSNPDVTWKAQMSTDEMDIKTLIEGDGPEVTADDAVLVNFWIGNGFTEEQAFSSYDDNAPESIDLSNKDILPVFSDSLVGETVGSRVAVTVNAEDVFGAAGNPSLGIANKDSVLFVFDVMGPYPIDAPYVEKGVDWTPDLVLDADGLPEAMRFMGRPKPTGELQVATLVEGDGPVIKKDDSILANYLGQAYARPKPFDTNFGSPATKFSLAGGVIEGWTKALTGLTVGSRVMLAIPPELGYGPEGNEGAKIKGTDTIYFLIDVLGAA